MMVSLVDAWLRGFRRHLLTMLVCHRPFLVFAVAGQSSSREQWGRYAIGVDCIVFVVDVADIPRIDEARRELHRLLEDPALATTPILVAANKVDLSPHLTEKELIKELNLDYCENPWIVIPMSAKFKTNLEPFLDWLIKQRKGEPTRGMESRKTVGLLSEAS
jgi:GTPase SAR1 family protein